MPDLNRDFVEGVWQIIEKKTTREYPYIEFRILFGEALKRFPGLTPASLQDALEELEESMRVDCTEGFSPTAEIRRTFPAD